MDVFGWSSVDDCSSNSNSQRHAAAILNQPPPSEKKLFSLQETLSGLRRYMATEAALRTFPAFILTFLFFLYVLPRENVRTHSFSRRNYRRLALLVRHSDSTCKCVDFLILSTSLLITLCSFSSSFVVVSSLPCADLAVANASSASLASSPFPSQLSIGAVELLSPTPSPSSLLVPSRLRHPILSLLSLALGLWRTQMSRSLLEGVSYERFGKSSPLCEEGTGRV